MSTHKRDRKNRAYNHGYRVGLAGRSLEQCPYDSVIELRGFWLSGWREGRDQFLWGTSNSIQNV